MILKLQYTLITDEQVTISIENIRGLERVPSLIIGLCCTIHFKELTPFSVELMKDGKLRRCNSTPKQILRACYDSTFLSQLDL